MTEVTYVQWQPHVDSDLPHLNALWIDVWSAHMWAIQLRRILSAPPDDRCLQIEPLVIAALTRYFRAFGSGRRARRLRVEDAVDLPEHLALAHAHLKAIRDKHIAHPVNRYELHQITLAIAELGTVRARATGVSPSSRAFHGLSLDEVIDLAALCEYWLAWLTDAKNTESARLLALALELSPAELNALPTGREESLDPNPFRYR